MKNLSLLTLPLAATLLVQPSLAHSGQPSAQGASQGASHGASKMNYNSDYKREKQLWVDTVKAQASEVDFPIRALSYQISEVTWNIQPTAGGLSDDDHRRLEAEMERRTGISGISFVDRKFTPEDSHNNHDYAKEKFLSCKSFAGDREKACDIGMDVKFTIDTMASCPAFHLGTSIAGADVGGQGAVWDSECAQGVLTKAKKRAADLRDFSPALGQEVIAIIDALSVDLPYRCVFKIFRNSLGAGAEGTQEFAPGGYNNFCASQRIHATKGLVDLAMAETLLSNRPIEKISSSITYDGFDKSGDAPAQTEAEKNGAAPANGKYVPMFVSKVMLFELGNGGSPIVHHTHGPQNPFLRRVLSGQLRGTDSDYSVGSWSTKFWYNESVKRILKELDYYAGEECKKTGRELNRERGVLLSTFRDSGDWFPMFVAECLPRGVSESSITYDLSALN